MSALLGLLYVNQTRERKNTVRCPLRGDRPNYNPGGEGGGPPYQRLINLSFPQPTGPPQKIRSGLPPPGGRTPPSGVPPEGCFYSQIAAHHVVDCLVVLNNQNTACRKHYSLHPQGGPAHLPPPGGVGGSPYQRLINLYFPQPPGPPQKIRSGLPPPGGRTRPPGGPPVGVIFILVGYVLSFL